MTDDARAEFKALLQRLEVTLPFPKSKVERRRLSNHVRKKLANWAKAIQSEKEEQERVSIINEYGLADATTLRVARNEKQRLDIIRALRLPMSTTLRGALRLREEHDYKLEMERCRLETDMAEALQRETRMRQKQEQKRIEAEKRRRLGLDAAADVVLAERLHKEVRRSLHALSGYHYLRCWVLQDGVRWYKIGITRNPDRREAEQNVLPVPATTILCVAMASIEHARSAEKAIHECLKSYRISGAGNSELFRLQSEHLAAVVNVMKPLDSSISSRDLL